MAEYASNRCVHQCSILDLFKFVEESLLKSRVSKILVTETGACISLLFELPLLKFSMDFLVDLITIASVYVVALNTISMGFLVALITHGMDILSL